MRYDPKKNRVCLEADELVRLAQGEIRHGRPSDDESCAGHRCPGAEGDVFLCEQNGLRYEITVRAHEREKDRIELRYALPAGVAKPTAEILRQARGEAFAAAHVLAQKNNVTRVKIAVVYLPTDLPSAGIGGGNVAPAASQTAAIKTAGGKAAPAESKTVAIKTVGGNVAPAEQKTVSLHTADGNAAGDPAVAAVSGIAAMPQTASAMSQTAAMLRTTTAAVSENASANGSASRSAPDSPLPESGSAAAPGGENIVGTSAPGAPVFEETVTAEKLTQFFARLLTSLLAYHSVELDRVCRRLPTMAKVKYPFSALREGQDAFISEAHRAMCRGERLFACAPTGIGKTMSVLFPAVRALGEGVFDKIFYFTPKTTVGEAAKEALLRLAHAGADLRGVEVLAKERICPSELVCRTDEGGRCPYSRCAPERETQAALSLLSSGKTVVQAEDIRRAAVEYRVCPYELSLRYAELCDVVICDYNYLFDLRVSFRRFFSTKGRWCFLVDEAHNLFDRVRACYSLTLTPSALCEMGERVSFLPQLSALFIQAGEGLRRLIAARTADSTGQDKQGVPVGFASEKAEPIALQKVICRLAEVCTDTQNEENTSLPPSHRRELCSVTYELYHMCDLLSLCDEHYVTFFRRRGEQYIFEMLCLDPAAVIDARLSLGQAAVLFSATLRPCDYYRDVLGGRRNDPLLDLPSPFPPENLSVSVMDKIGVGYSAREATLSAVVRTILVTVRARPGNYMVFCPSYAYQQAVAGRLKKAVPGLCVMEQTPHMSDAERAAFLAAFSEDNKKALIGFCVMGGIYGEGIDLTGRRLIGAIVVGVGLPSLSDEREAMRAYYEEKYEAGHAYAYVYPGMNRVMQAAGRVIRTEKDKGVVVLIDERFGSPEYRALYPVAWHTLRFAGDTDALAVRLRDFWQGKRDGH